uniref:Uncharacterized protein n=1 Tax=Alexandrium catenella TaxID=2925 RepID=A0A7S1S357_ALECA
MAAVLRAAAVWAPLAAAALAAAAPNATAAGNGTNVQPAAAPGGASAESRLFNTLLVTFGAIFLGLICVRLGLVVPEKGDTKAMGFYTGKIAFPLLIFSTVATADLGNVNLGTVAACNLGKLAVMLLTGVLAFFAYKPGRDVGQQVLTSTVFAFFAVASNDFAIGFPVIDAIYGPSMAVYIAANALVGSFLFVPLTVVLFSIGQALQKRGKSGGGGDESTGSAVLHTLRDLLLNPVITCTVAGLLYKVILPFTLRREGDKLVLPTLLHDLIKTFTAPFVMSALFLTGTTLKSASLAIWPCSLVIMKVVVCAFVSYLFGQLFVGNAGDLRSQLVNFTFFYGSIPTSSAPLVFASQFDPGASELVSTAILLGLILAGPIMFVTAIILSDSSSMMGTLNLTQLSAISASLVCGAMLVVLIAILRREWGFWCPCKKMIAAYTAVMIAYEALALFFNPSVVSGLCDNYRMNFWSPVALVLSWLQNASRLMLLFGQFALVTGPDESEHAPILGNMVLLMCLGFAVVVAFFAGPNTVDQVCHKDLDMGSDFRLISGFVWTCLLLLASLVLATIGILRRRKRAQTKAHAKEALDSSDSESSEDVRACEAPSAPSASGDAARQQCPMWLVKLPKDVLLPMSIVFTLTLLTQFVNTSLVINGAMGSGSFLVMLILESLLVHGQLVYLALSVFLSENMTSHAALAVPRLCPCLRRRERAGTPGASGDREEAAGGVLVPDAMLGSYRIPTSGVGGHVPTAVPRETDDGVDEQSDDSEKSDYSA